MASPPSNLATNDVITETWTDAVTNGASGRVGYASVTSAQGSITTMTDLTSLSVTWSATSTRYYRVTFKVLIYSSVANDLANLWLRNGSSTSLNAYGSPSLSTTHGANISGTHVLSGISGSYTVKLSLERSVGTGNLTSTAGSTYPAFILVEDMGTA